MIKQKPNYFIIYCLHLLISFSCVAQTNQGEIKDAVNGTEAKMVDIFPSSIVINFIFL